MSQKARAWAYKVCRGKGLKPATKWALLHLADFHQPGRGCWPDVDTIATESEIPRSTLFRHLALLELLGFFRRTRQEVSSSTGRFETVRFVLAFEENAEPRAWDGTEKPSPKMGFGKGEVELALLPSSPSLNLGHGAESQNGTRHRVPKNGETESHFETETSITPYRVNDPTNSARETERPRAPSWWADVVAQISADLDQKDRLTYINAIQAVEYIKVVHLLVPNQIVEQWHKSHGTAGIVAKLSAELGCDKRVEVRVGSTSAPLYPRDGVRTAVGAQ